mgnify:CR=1 FL=1
MKTYIKHRKKKFQGGKMYMLEHMNITLIFLFYFTFLHHIHTHIYIYTFRLAIIIVEDFFSLFCSLQSLRNQPS